PPNLPQFTPKEALQKGTLWPVFYDYDEKTL
ncbi:spore coat associated protein CotJA, partial [Bacillus sp. HC-TM]